MVRVIIDGWDGTDAHFRVRSFTDRRLWYVVWCRLDNGNMRCDCMDASCRSKVGNLYRESTFCKHAALLLSKLRPLMDADILKALKPELVAAMLDDRFQPGGY